MSENRTSTFLLGTISAPHGIKGEVKLPSRLVGNLECGNVDEVYLQFRDGSRQKRRLLSIRRASKSILLKIEGVNDRNEAEKLRGVDVYVDGGYLPEAEDGEYYWQDLIGSVVRLKSGEDIGKVLRVMETGPYDMLVVDKGSKELLVPFVENILVSVDIGSKLIIIDPPEGLIELADE